jgi:hypothetical protein
MEILGETNRRQKGGNLKVKKETVSLVNMLETNDNH